MKDQGKYESNILREDLTCHVQAGDLYLTGIFDDSPS